MKRMPAIGRDPPCRERGSCPALPRRAARGPDGGDPPPGWPGTSSTVPEEKRNT
ncbi:hypothetical protein ASZ90_009967 [hydrocarbon metagenome]|uniref:Uncharacterized protein n=1 Tax=hydrocarbon metagenome TaxID=938273 RepID=A0A0W8FHG1_9ZZZZ